MSIGSDLGKKHPVPAEYFSPFFRQDVEKVFTANGQRQPVNQVYCLTDFSAEQLAAILEDLSPCIVPADPMPVSGGMVYVNAFDDPVLVPWLKFPSGACVNCGLTANYWTNTDGETAENRARQDIASAESEYAINGSDQYPVQLRG